MSTTSSCKHTDASQHAPEIVIDKDWLVSESYGPIDYGFLIDLLSSPWLKILSLIAKLNRTTTTTTPTPVIAETIRKEPVSLECASTEREESQSASDSEYDSDSESEYESDWTESDYETESESECESDFGWETDDAVESELEVERERGIEAHETDEMMEEHWRDLLRCKIWCLSPKDVKRVTARDRAGEDVSVDELQRLEDNWLALPEAERERRIVYSKTWYLSPEDVKRFKARARAGEDISVDELQRLEDNWLALPKAERERRIEAHRRRQERQEREAKFWEEHEEWKRERARFYAELEKREEDHRREMLRYKVWCLSPEDREHIAAKSRAGEDNTVDELQRLEDNWLALPEAEREKRIEAHRRRQEWKWERARKLAEHQEMMEEHLHIREMLLHCKTWSISPADVKRIAAKWRPDEHVSVDDLQRLEDNWLALSEELNNKDIDAHS